MNRNLSNQNPTSALRTKFSEPGHVPTFCHITDCQITTRLNNGHNDQNKQLLNMTDILHIPELATLGVDFIKQWKCLITIG